MNFAATLALGVVCCFPSLGEARRILNKHPPLPRSVHITRLLRNDHSGLAVLMEAEARWQRATPSLVQVEKPKREFLLISTQQMASLQQHQTSALANSPSSFLDVQGAEDAEVSPTAMKLSNLGPEYVGPIGVGTVHTSEGCSMAEGAKKGSGSRACAKSGAESHVWVVFDTGSTNIWVNSDACTKGSCVKTGRIQYNHTRSETFKAPEGDRHRHAKFGTGELNGLSAVDDFSIGPLVMHNQTFGMISEAKGSTFEGIPIEGLVGLGFQSMVAKGGGMSFFDNACQQSTLPKNEVSFYISYDNPSANAMLWGGVDSKFHTGTIEYFNVSRPFYWSLDLKGFKVGKDEMLAITFGAGGGAATSFLQAETSLVNRYAIVDTGTTYFTAPQELFEKIMKRLPRTACDKMTEETHPPVTVQLENAAGQPHDFTLTNSEYMVSSGRNNATCSPAFMSLALKKPYDQSMILGDVFLRRYYSVFDRADCVEKNARVGFARAAHGDTTESYLRSITKDQPSFNERHRW